MVYRSRVGPPGLAATARARLHLHRDDALHCALFPDGRAADDLAAGQDRLLARLAPKLGPRGWIAVEPWPTDLSGRLRRAGRETETVTRGSIPPLQTAELQGALLLEAVQGARDRGALLSGLRQALTPGGALVVADLLATGPAEGARSGLLSLPELIAELLELGFEVLEETLLNREVAPTFRLLSVAAGAAAPAGDLALAADLEGLREWSRLQAERLESGAACYAVIALRRGEHRIRSLQPGDDEGLSALFERCFGSARSPEEWRWRWRQPHPAASVAVSPAGDPVAYYGGHPVVFRLHGPGGVRRLRAIQVGDTMTDPGVRRIGRRRTALLARTSRHFFARNCQGRVELNYGFNRGAIQRFSLRLPDAAFVGEVPWWSLDAPASQLALDAPAPREWPAYVTRRVHSVGPDWDALLSRAGPAYGFLAERDARYLTWRYLERPRGRYRLLAARHEGMLVAWAAFRREGERLVWGDALVDAAHPLAARALLRAVLAEVEPPPTRIEAWFSTTPDWWKRLLEGLGFRRAPEPNGLGMVYRPFGAERLDEHLRGRLYYTMGDSDLF